MLQNLKNPIYTVIIKKCSSFGIYSCLILAKFDKSFSELGIYLSAV
jgi:hypothetical protein